MINHAHNAVAYELMKDMMEKDWSAEDRRFIEEMQAMKGEIPMDRYGVRLMNIEILLSNIWEAVKPRSRFELTPEEMAQGLKLIRGGKE